MWYRQQLAQVPVLGSLEQDVRVALTRKLVLRSFSHGSDIITQGEIGTSMFIVDEGECVVKVSKPQTDTSQTTVRCVWI